LEAPASKILKSEVGTSKVFLETSEVSDNQLNRKVFYFLKQKVYI